MIPKRGFKKEEFENRVLKAQKKMREENLDSLFLTCEHHFRYFSGFLSQFWQSPTRPWYLIVPSSGKPIAVVPDIGSEALKSTWLDEIHTWSAPFPKDDGLSLVQRVLKENSSSFGRIGVPMCHEDTVRMPLKDFFKIQKELSSKEFVDCSQLLKDLLVVKSKAEIEKIRHICQIASRGFEEFPNFAKTGDSEIGVCRAFKKTLLTLGADDTPYMIGASGQGGYDNIIMGPTDKELYKGDVFIVDTGAVFDGYFCDFDRNFIFGSQASDLTRKAYDTVYKATDAGFTAARPGATTYDLWNAMWGVLEKGGAKSSSVGRLGHGLGMLLTEYPSHSPYDKTVLKEGMVLTLEPGMSFAPQKEMVHEENIVITADGAEYLSTRAQPEIVQL